jgi:hypothetical protein
MPRRTSEAHHEFAAQLRRSHHEIWCPNDRGAPPESVEVVGGTPSVGTILSAELRMQSAE